MVISNNNANRSRGGIAFKCNFCDGGRGNGEFGFNGVCSNDNIHYNIYTAKRRWCSESACSRYIKREIEYEQLSQEKFLCYESTLLVDWRMRAGIDIENDSKRRIKGAKVGGLCVLTTLERYAAEKDRKVFALFLIDDCSVGDRNSEGYVASSSENRLKFSIDEKQNFNYWDFYQTSNSTADSWRSGLFRYLTNQQSLQILENAVNVKTNTADSTLAKAMLDRFKSGYSQ
ncbi:MAG: hypothetical protein LBS90_06060 [Oscillospiraceae bacterium]|jgi:hypothetical protein|nr:hypothetical protein [Oscillospiraceae bacterium]